MATDRERQNESHFDSTSVTVEADGEQIPHSDITYSAGQRQRGRVVVNGSRLPVGDTEGILTPGMGKITMARRHATDWLASLKNRYGDYYGSRAIPFVVKYSPIDEEGSELPAESDDFVAKIDPPSDLAISRSGGEAALMVEINLFIVGSVFINGVEQK